MSYVFKSGEFTSVGRNPKRPINEDFVGKYEPHDDPTLAERGYLYVVADGMGGHAAGEVASRYAVEKVLYEYYNGEWIDPATNLQRAVEIANDDVYEESLQNPTREEMGTTIVAAVLRDDGELTIAHVGDSRAYLVRDGEIRQLTRDHSRVQADLDRGLLTEADSPHHRERHVLTQSIGGDADVRVELTFETVQADDYLLLCTDGVWGVLGAEGMVRAVQRIRQPGLAARAIVEQVDHLGGPDNSTVCLIRAVPAASEEATIVSEEEEDPTVDIPEAPRFDTSPEVRTISTPEVQKPWPGDIRLIASGLAVALIVVVAGWRVIASRDTTPSSPKIAVQRQAGTATATIPAPGTAIPGVREAATATSSLVAAALATRSPAVVTPVPTASGTAEERLPLGCGNIVTNGGFEIDADGRYGPDGWDTEEWIGGNYAMWGQGFAYKGDWAVFLGLQVDQADEVDLDEVAQEVALPAELGRVFLRFWYLIGFQDLGDGAYCGIRT